MPIGSIPRTFTAIAKGENVRKCIPGDIIRLEGSLETTHSSSASGHMLMLHSLFIDIFSIEREKKKYEYFEPSSDIENKIHDLHENQKSSTVYLQLAKSLAPEIYGMEDVKKALLLLLGSISNLN